MSFPRLVQMVPGALALLAATLTAQSRPGLRTLATFSAEGSGDFNTSPDGRFILQNSSAGLRMYEVASKQSWGVVEGATWNLNWSPRGDMIAYVRAGDGDTGEYVWLLPLDAKTGKARGPAQRVTTGQGESPAFSPDGKWIAFAGLDSGKATHVSIVPATGGPERVLARFPSLIEQFYWGADGKTIYFDGPAPGITPRKWAFLKITVEGGAIAVIPRGNSVVTGITSDRRHFVLAPNTGKVAAGAQITIIDTTGREVGHLPMPVSGGPVWYDKVLGDSALVWITKTDHRLLEIRSLAGGTPTRLPLIGESDDNPVWSPDGKRIAFQVSEGDRTSLAVMNADGTSVRVFRNAEVFPWVGLTWSPDSRRLAYKGLANHAVSVLDVVAGTKHTLMEDTTSMFSTPQWRPDGQAVVVMTDHQSGTPRKNIHELTLGGQHRILFELKTSTSGLNTLDRAFNGFAFLGAAEAFVRSDGAASVITLATGSSRRLADVPLGSSAFNTVVSGDRRWIGGVLTDSTARPSKRIEWYSVASGARTVLDMPFEMLVNHRVVFQPRDSALLVVGQRSGEANMSIYRVPLNGDTPRAVADIGKSRALASGSNGLSASPDGRSVVYSVQPESGTNALLLINLRGAVPGTTSRTPRQ